MTGYLEMRLGHFTGWMPDMKLHAHTGRCIKCGCTEGDSEIYVQVITQGRSLGLDSTGIGNRLCPACKAKYQPLTPEMRQELDRLSGKLWRDLRKRGCPCCQSGLAWHPVEH